jgi:hypothetical protein
VRTSEVAARLAEASQKRVAQAITRKLQRTGSATRRELLQACASSMRGDFAPVFDMFFDNEFIILCEGGEGYPARYRLAG